MSTSPPTGPKTSTPLWDQLAKTVTQGGVHGWTMGYSITMGNSTNGAIWEEVPAWLFQGSVTYHYSINAKTGGIEITPIAYPPYKRPRRGHRHKLRMPELEIGDI